MLLLRLGLTSLAITLKILIYHLPIRIQGQLMIHSLTYQRNITVGILAFSAIYYQWLSLCIQYPDIVSKGKNKAQGSAQEQITDLVKALESEQTEDHGETILDTDSKKNRIGIDFVNGNHEPMTSSREQALQKMIEQLTKPQSPLTEHQLAILKHINYKENPILDELGEKTVVLHQASLNSEINTDIPSNTKDILESSSEAKSQTDTLYELTSEMRKLQVRQPDSVSYNDALNRANSLKDELLGEYSKELPLEKIDFSITEKSDLVDTIARFYDEPASPTGQAVRPFTELKNLLEKLAEQNATSASAVTVYSSNESKSNSNLLEYFTEIISNSNYDLIFSISFIFLLVPFFFLLYKLTYLALTFLLPEYKINYPRFFARHAKLSKFVCNLMKDPKKLHNLRFVLSVSCLYYGIVNFVFISYTFKIIAKIIKILR